MKKEAMANAPKTSTQLEAATQSRDSREPVAATQTATQWLSVAEASRLEGITPRAIQRRCKAGKYTFRSVETPIGTRFEIDAATLDKAATQSGDASRDRGEPVAATPATEAATGRGELPERAKEKTASAAEIEAERLRGEVEFWKARVVAHEVAERELREALLREQQAHAEARRLHGATFQMLPMTEPRDILQTERDTNAKDAAQPETVGAQTQKSAAQKEPRPLWKLILGVR